MNSFGDIVLMLLTFFLLPIWLAVRLMTWLGWWHPDNEQWFLEEWWKRATAWWRGE